MPTRYKRKNRKYLGSRFHGAGNAKHRRGKGCRGGWGRAGSHKHGWTRVTANEPDFFGVHGFSCPTTKLVPAINLYDINNKARNNELQSAGGKLTFDFDGKVLGSGVLEFPIVVKADAASAGAIEKIKKAGGQFIARAGAPQNDTAGGKGAAGSKQ